MQTIHVLEIQKLDVICEDNRGFDEKNLCLQLFLMPVIPYLYSALSIFSKGL